MSQIVGETHNANGVAQDAEADLPAGDFSTWLAAYRSARMNDTGMAVPCGACTACCTSSYYIRIEPHETGTLSRLPPDLPWVQPRRVGGEVLIGFDGRGVCPLFADGGCSIYAHRPNGCRNYDCRIFQAAGVTPSEADKPLIARQARRWRFEYPTPRDAAEHAAVRAVVTFVREHQALFGATGPRHPTQLAALAIEAYDVMLPFQDGSHVGEQPTAQALAAAIRAAQQRFQASGRH